MRLYFDQKEKIEMLEEAAKSWIGVPYRHTGESRTGTDCAKYIALLFVELEILSKIEGGIIYPRDWYIHGHVEILIDSFAEHGQRYIRPGLQMRIYNYESIAALMPGDVLLIATSTSICNHAALYLGNGKIIHCLEKKGVFVADLPCQPWVSKIKKFFRVNYVS